MILESEIRQRVAAVASGQLSLDAFERWIGPASRSMHRDSAPEAIRLAADIQHMFAAYDNGYIDAERVQWELGSLLNNVNRSIVFGDDLAAVSVDALHVDRPQIVFAVSSSRWSPVPALVRAAA